MFDRLSFLLFVLVILFPALDASAQEAVRVPWAAGKTDGTDEEGHWCATPYMANSPEGRAALLRFHEARANGTLPRASKNQAVYEIGAMQMFNIVEDSFSVWVPAQFELRATGSRFNLWLRTDDPGQPEISDARIEELRQALDEVTPPGSLHPDKGIMEIAELVFGEPPVYPAGSDGVVDILVYDLVPGAAGAVFPADFDPSAEAGTGNQGEVLHLDYTTFFITSDGRIESVIAHEYQHLIHFNYDPTHREDFFVDEGLSEYAQLLLGYQATLPYYLLVIPAEYNIPLFSWRRGDDGVASLNDYSRASVWHGYLGDQLGPELTGSITREPKIGLEGYKEVLKGSDKTIDELILDFHTALIVNDLSVDPRFGIKDPVRTSQIDILIPRNRSFDGSRGTEGNLDSLVIQPGGTEYIQWTNVSDLSFTFDVKAGPDLIEGRRLNARVRVIVEPIDGDIAFFEYPPSTDIHLIQGTFKKVILVAANLRPEVVALPAYLHSSWSSEGALQIVSYAYGQDLPYNGSPFVMAGGSDGAFAVAFPVPIGGALNDIELAVFHRSQFQGGSLVDPRDYLLTIWDNAGGKPGDVIYSELYENPNPTQPLTVAAYDWESFSLNPPLAKRQALPDTVYIGAREVGADDNYMVLWPARVTGLGFPGTLPYDTGFIGDRDSLGMRTWVHSWDVTFTDSEPGDRPLRSTALPVRARFLIDPAAVAVEESGELPSAIALGQNFPNPFNPSTRIEFAIPDAVDVQLKVFDLTGREVASVIDGPRAAGTYIVTLNASTWASGMYVYRLQAGDQQVVKRMILLK